MYRGGMIVRDEGGLSRSCEGLQLEGLVLDQLRLHLSKQLVRHLLEIRELFQVRMSCACDSMIGRDGAGS